MMESKPSKGDTLLANAAEMELTEVDKRDDARSHTKGR